LNVAARIVVFDVECAPSFEKVFGGGGKSYFVRKCNSGGKPIVYGPEQEEKCLRAAL